MNHDSFTNQYLILLCWLLLLSSACGCERGGKGRVPESAGEISLMDDEVIEFGENTFQERSQTILDDEEEPSLEDESDPGPPRCSQADCKHFCDGSASGEKKRALRVKVPGVRSRGELPPEGAISDVWVAVVSHPGVRASHQPVGIFEDITMGTGDAWRSTAWTASFMAPDLLNIDMGSRHLEFWTRGAIDGPSAGALLTTAIVALERKQVSLRQNVTMTGTIEPDGSIGEVGGLREKLQAIARDDEGKLDTFLVPNSQLATTDPDTGERIDLVALGRQLGIKVVGVETIWDAYAQLTKDKDPLQGPATVAPEGLQMSAKRKAAVANVVRMWLTKVERGQEQSESNDPGGPESDRLGALWKEHYESGQKLLQEGSEAAALWHAKQARVHQLAAVSARRFERGMLAGDASVIPAAFEEVDVVTRRVAAARREISNRVLPSIDETILLTHLQNEMFVAGFTSDLFQYELRQAMVILRGQDIPDDQKAAAMLQMLGRLSLLMGKLQVASESAELVGQGLFGTVPDRAVPSSDCVSKATMRYNAHGRANWAFLQSTFFSQSAAYGLAEGDLENLVLTQDPTILFYRMANHEVADWKLGLERGESARARLGQLAAARLTSDLSSFLITKYSTLKAQGDGRGHLVATDGAALDRYLRRAIGQAAAYIEYLRKTGGSAPLATELAFLQARHLMTLGQTERLDALELSWRAVADVRMSITLNRDLTRARD